MIDLLWAVFIAALVADVLALMALGSATNHTLCGQPGPGISDKVFSLVLGVAYWMMYLGGFSGVVLAVVLDATGVRILCGVLGCAMLALNARVLFATARFPWRRRKPDRTQ